MPSVTASSTAVTPTAMAVKMNASGDSTEATRARLPQSVVAIDWIAANTQEGDGEQRGEAGHLGVLAGEPP